MSKKNNRIYLSSPHMGGRELNYIHDAFASNWIAPLGDNVDGFESDLQNYTGSPHAAVVTSGTAALHLALILCDVSAGDEVICQSFTFTASANPILYQGATPIFVDSEADTWNMDPQLLEKAIEDRIRKKVKPKAIIVVHLYGMPAKMDQILDVASKYDIPVIEDAAEALGSSINGQKCGAFGGFAVLSFNGNKIITTSGGGALLSHDNELIKKARFLATQARDQAPHYQHSVLGYNYRMSNIVAGIGRGQMKVLDDRVRARRRNHQYYFESLQGSWLDLQTRGTKISIRNTSESGIYFLKEPQGFFSNRWLTTAIVNPDETGGITAEDIRVALE
ncbi:MAG: DegT/DnrJ/EryC1/StrS family aminotransferase, partial [Bacteroidota bacterium]